MKLKLVKIKTQVVNAPRQAANDSVKPGPSPVTPSAA